MSRAIIRAKQIEPFVWELSPPAPRVARALAYADSELLQAMSQDNTLGQLCTIATMPGVVGPVLAMPDAHQGYGMPIGGVAAFDPEQGVIAPGAVGYDINCGVRLLRTKLRAADLAPGLPGLADALAQAIPAGVGVGGGVRAGAKELARVMRRGAAWALEQGFGSGGDLEYCEAGGALPGADPDAVSPAALKRGLGQVGTLGAGNHFVELARVDRVYDPLAAAAFGLEPGQLVVWVHSGSRGLGHQVCTDYLHEFATNKYAVHTKDRQLIAAPPGSPPGRAYLGAMAAAANYAFANRQVLSGLTQRAICQFLGMGPAALGMGLVYDLAHNVAKLEAHQVAGKERKLWVVRKGATRALGPGNPELTSRYRSVGQPVLLPGDMGRASYILRGTALAQERTFASSAHGAGRRLSRTQAKKQARGRDLRAELAQSGVQVRAHSPATLAEEMPLAYKDAAQVVGVMHGSGVAPKVAHTVPLLVIKG